VINVEHEVTRYIRIPEALSNAVLERLTQEAHLFRPGHGWDDLVIPFLQAYVESEPETPRAVLIEQALNDVRTGFQSLI